MQLVQLSSAQGPLECSLAVEKALGYFIAQLERQKIAYELLEKVEDRIGFKSILLSLDIDGHHPLILEWQGTHQWIWQSKIRPKHQRKNWFFGVAFFTPPQEIPDSEIQYKAITSQGAGGQHVNKTASAIQAVHVTTGIAVKVQSERSQHANKRLAKLLIQQKLSERVEDALDEAGKIRRLVHHQLERGQALKVFEGDHFTLRS